MSTGHKEISKLFFACVSSRQSQIKSLTRDSSKRAAGQKHSITVKPNWARR